MKNLLFLFLFSLCTLVSAQTGLQETDLFTSNPKLTAAAVIAFLLYVSKFFYDKAEKNAKENHEMNAVKIGDLQKEVNDLNVYIKTEFHSIIEKNNQLFEKILIKLENDKKE